MHRILAVLVLCAAAGGPAQGQGIGQAPTGGIGADGCAVSALREGVWGMHAPAVQRRAVARWQDAAARFLGPSFADVTASARRNRVATCEVDDSSIGRAIWCEIIARPCGPSARPGTGGPLVWMPGPGGAFRLR